MPASVAESEEVGEPLEVCVRCEYTACGDCRVHHSKGTCFCKDSNFNFRYPADPAEREWYHTGYW